jgi:hypothetical protein
VIEDRVEEVPQVLRVSVYFDHEIVLPTQYVVPYIALPQEAMIIPMRITIGLEMSKP